MAILCNAVIEVTGCLFVAKDPAKHVYICIH